MPSAVTPPYFSINAFRGHHSLHLVGAADVAGIDADFVRPVLHGGDGHLVVKVDVRHQGDMYLLFDLRKGFCGLHVRHRAAHDFAARLLQRQNLGHGGGHVLGPGVGHGLNQDRIASPYFSVAYLYYSRLLPVHGSLLFQNISSRNLQATYHTAFRKSLGAIPPLFQAPSCHNA